MRILFLSRRFTRILDQNPSFLGHMVGKRGTPEAAVTSRFLLWCRMSWF